MSLLLRETSQGTGAATPSGPHASFSSINGRFVSEGMHPNIPIPIDSNDEYRPQHLQGSSLARARTIATLVPQNQHYTTDFPPIQRSAAITRREQTQPALNSAFSQFQIPLVTALNSENRSIAQINPPHSQLQEVTESNDFPDHFDVDEDDADLAPTVPISPWEDLPHATRLMRRALRKGIKVRDFGFKPDDERHYGKVDDWLWKLGYAETGLGENWKAECQPRPPWERADSGQEEKENVGVDGPSPSGKAKGKSCVPSIHFSRSPFSPQILTEKLRGVKRERSADSPDLPFDIRSPTKVPKLELRKDGEDVIMRSPRDGER